MCSVSSPARSSCRSPLRRSPPPDRAACRGGCWDPAGARCPTRSVALLSPLGAIAATARTDAAGAFRLDAVPSGSYVLTAGSPDSPRGAWRSGSRRTGRSRRWPWACSPEALPRRDHRHRHPGARRRARGRRPAGERDRRGGDRAAREDRAGPGGERGGGPPRSSARAPRSPASSCAGSPAPRSTSTWTACATRPRPSGAASARSSTWWSRRRSRGSRWCGAPRARSTAATRSAGRCSS